MTLWLKRQARGRHRVVTKMAFIGGRRGIAAGTAAMRRVLLLGGCIDVERACDTAPIPVLALLAPSAAGVCQSNQTSLLPERPWLRKLPGAMLGADL